MKPAVNDNVASCGRDCRSCGGICPAVPVIAPAGGRRQPVRFHRDLPAALSLLFG